MITKQHRQEALCRAYVHAVAAQAGLLCSRPDPDYGIDLSLRMVEVRDHRYVDTSVQIDLQLRSTTQANVTAKEAKVDLDVKTYDYLRTPTIFCPRFLVVLVMPAEEADWLSQSPSELAIRHCAYWLSLAGYPATAGIRTVRVAIPLANSFSLEAVRTLLHHVRERKEP